MNPFSLDNKHILITGASSGIGRQCAISCSRFGAKVTLVGRNKNRLSETISKMTENNHHIICSDISEIDNIEKIVTEAIEVNGKFDGLIHSAGIETTLPLKMHKNHIIDKQMKINVYAGIEFIRVLSLKKNSNNFASFVLISSIRGILGSPGLVGYCTTKGALLMAVKAMASELAVRSIRINAISPGQVEDTAMTENILNELSEMLLKKNKEAHLLGWLSTEDVANGAIYLLSNASKKVTGSNLIIDSGYTSK